MTLAGRVAWITGAGSGIGLAAAHELAAAGAAVVLSGRRAEPLAHAAAALRAAGAQAQEAPLDVADAPAVARTAQAILARHGRVDILVNSAGLNVPQRFWRNLTVAGYEEVVRVNLHGAFYCTHAVLPAMRARGDGLIINIASWAGRHVMALVGPAYNAAKHAMVALTETINIEEGRHGIRACAICPGEVATPILDQRPVPPSPEERAKMLQPEDLGRTIRWVAEQPPHVCVNEILISPTYNRIYLGGPDLSGR
ncbi:MAG: SDR family NAD(P)-dependent oxidoreductase [Sutterellaceae bacterium]|nr:SDR family NAD(P)-dependent oxidoreductase [Burkholderiaceae bacterium]MCX7901801.1 SDR family NAD(P)-dependent oxidoreductase [Burkholderiaceae bacterium]MDW8429461.1 SDR family NAD(P)-dependent oxidoreductase [Sutterellaceae bacterium]